MAAETRNGGISLNNNNCKDHSRRKLLVGVDLFCLFLGKILFTAGALNLRAGIGFRNGVML